MQSERNYSTNLRERMFSMQQTCWRTDCKFLVGEEAQEVEVHKVILASASPVFDAMFYGEMAESQTTIPIPDIQPDVFQAMLEYIYTDDVKLSSFDDASNLYYAANKYILTNLKKICITYIESNLTKDNVCQVYEFGEMFEEKNLMNMCLAFIAEEENRIDFLGKNLRTNVFDDKIKLSTLVAIFSLETNTGLNALFFFELIEQYVKTQMKHNIMHSTSSDSDGELSSQKSSESSMFKDMVVVNEENKAEDSKDSSEGSTGQDQRTTPPLTESKEKPNVRALLEKIHFLKMTPKQFADGPAKSGLLTLAEKFAIFMNIASDETNVPMPSGFSTYRSKKTKFYVRCS